MVDLKKADPLKLIKCDNAECGRYSFEQDIEKNDWGCPHCGRLLSKSDRQLRSDVSSREKVVPSYVCDSKAKLRELIDFLISQKRKVIVKIEGNRTPYTSRIIKAAYGDIFSQVGKGDELIIEMLTPDTGNTFLKFSHSVVVQFFLRNKLCQFESKYLGESLQYPHIGLIVCFPESVEMK